MCIEIIKNNREMILIGEIGALLHDIGKCHPDFIKKQSLEKIENLPHHAKNIDKFMNNELIQYFKDEKFILKLLNEEKSIYDFIRYHHDSDGNLIKYLQTCDCLDSADDKGIVRKKQSIENTIIASPFGYPREQVDLSCLHKRFNDLEDNLIGLFKNYISETTDLGDFRQSIIVNLKIAFSHALGETRIPSNDITLWDHSYSTASLFKSVLCSLALGENPDPQNLQWRLLGFCWDGIGFINKGRKVTDILKRSEIIEEIKRELEKKFEDEIPIGNAIYEDINGIYFTFPALVNGNAKELAKVCAQEGLKIIKENCDNEIWPFFTLSKPSRKLTILAEELRFASEKRNIPKISPMIFFEEGKEKISDNPEMAVPKAGEDICPVCKIRAKPENNERCDICDKRRKGRLTEWLSSRENTIWTDEVADVNNRIALLTLNFDLDKWLDGTMIGTIYSQSFDDWLAKEKENLYKIQDELKTEIMKQIESLEKAIEEMKRAKDPDRVKAGIEEKIKEKKELEQKIKKLTFSLSPDKEATYKILNVFLKLKDRDKKRAVSILKTFFEENIGLDDLEKHLTNIKERISADNLTEKNLATYLFTQNPSPARLYRIWRETEEFFELVVNEIKAEFYSHKWERYSFKVNPQSLKLKNGSELKQNTPYIIKIKELEPESILIIHTSNEQFYTIESLKKFKFKEKTGIDAVKDASKNNSFYWFAEEEEPDKNLLQNGKIKIDKSDSEEYYPFIEITKSPLQLRLIVPASDSIKIVELLIKLYNNRFEKVIGKLPLNIGLLVSKRKFPLYVLLEAGERMLQSDGFKEPVMINVWWNLDGVRNDEYYRFYPTKILKYTLDDLVSLSNGKSYALYPGFFDFDLLLATTDRYNITYKGQKRTGEDYSYYLARPYYLYQVSQIIELWEILKNNLSSSQINYIEETLTGKLREWRDVNDSNKECVFIKFVEATLRDAFADRWEKLRRETQDFIMNSALNGLLLDTVVFFRHLIKEKEAEENE
jgi:hypothetical protein